MMKLGLLIVVAALCAGASSAQVQAHFQNKPLSNQDIIRMAKAKLSDAVISKAIAANDTAFDLSANALIALVDSGVTQVVIQAMLSADARKKDRAVPPPPSPAIPPPSQLLISQYMRDAGLLYVETVEKAFSQALQDHIAWMNGDRRTQGGVDTGESGDALKALEDRMEIHMSGEADKKFLDLLELTKSAASTTFLDSLRSVDPFYAKHYPAQPAVAKLFPSCLAQVRVIIREGIYSEKICSPELFIAAHKADDASGAGMIK
jgi:hypothetical protein